MRAHTHRDIYLVDCMMFKELKKGNERTEGERDREGAKIDRQTDRQRETCTQY